MLRGTEHRHHPNELDEAGNTAIILACEHGRFDVLLALLLFMHQSAPQLRNLNVRNPDGQTPLIVASRFGHSDCMLAVSQLTFINMYVLMTSFK